MAAVTLLELAADDLIRNEVSQRLNLLTSDAKALAVHLRLELGLLRCHAAFSPVAVLTDA